MAGRTNHPSKQAKRTRVPTPRGVSRRVKPNRPQKVWMSLIAAMTVVGGGLIALDRKPAVGADGLALPPLMSITGPNSVEMVLNTRVPQIKGQWKSIVIHDSGSPVGSPASLDASARQNGLKGIGYNFVIGNGNGMADGEIHVTNRWMQQIPGAHAAGPRADEFNRTGIGICLVGDGNRQQFTRAQLDRLAQLLELLTRECGIPPERVYLHSDIAQTSSPGRLFPASVIRAQLVGGR